MNKLIVYCVSTIDDFNREKFDRLGLGVEIQDFTHPELLDLGWEDRVKEYKKTLEGFSNTISIHGPFLDLKPISPDKPIRDASHNRYLTSLNIAKELNADYCIFHSQINPWLNEPVIKDLNNNLNKDFWRNILKEVEDFRGTILIENIFEDDPILLKELIDTIDLPNVKVCLDIGHARLRNNKGLEEWVRILKDKIKYIHFHWNEGLYDEHHRPLDENIVFMKGLLRKHKIEPIIALEYHIDNLEKEIKRFK
jgi:sugar phosphate isomerase/epimerase